MKKIFTCMALVLFSLSLTMAAETPKMQSDRNQQEKINRQKNNKVKTDTPASRTVVSRAIADYNYTEIAIPYSQNHSFTIDGYDDLKVVPLKFTLTETSLLSFLGYNSDVNRYARAELYDSEFNYIQYIWFDNYMKVLEAGTYYLLLNDDYYYWYYEEELTCNISINSINLAAVTTTITSFPYSENNIALSPIEGLSYDPAALYKFTLTETSILSFSGYNSDSDWTPYFNLYPGGLQNNPIHSGSFDGFSKILEAGTYYLKLSDYYNEGYTCNISIEATNFESLVTPITLPYSAKNVAFNRGGIGVPLKFTLTETTTLAFSGYNSDLDCSPRFELFRESFEDVIIYNERFDGHVITLSPGTYYLLLNDDYYTDYNCDVNIRAITTANINFKTITLPYSETALSFSPINGLGNKGYAPFKFTLTKPTLLSFSGYNNNLNWGPNFTLFNGNLQTPIVTNSWFDGFSRMLEAGTYYLLIDNHYSIAEYTCDIRINSMDQFISFRDVNYSKKVEVNAPATGSISKIVKYVNDADIVAPAIGYNFAAKAEKTYLFTYTVYAPQSSQLSSAMSLLSGKIGGTTDYDDVYVNSRYNHWYGERLTIYLHYYSSKTENLNILLQASGNDELVYSLTVSEMNDGANALTLSQMLNATTTTIPYSSNLSYTDWGVLGNTGTSLVKGLRYDNEDVFYAKAYKISLTQGNTIKIHESFSNDAYLYLYKKVAGNYILVDSNDDYYNYSDVDCDNCNGYDSYIQFTAETAADAGDYYIVASSLGSNSVGSFYLTVWNTASESANSYIGSLQSIVCPIKSLSIPRNTTDVEIRVKLLELKLTGKVAANGKQIDILLENSPYAWTIAQDGRSATYTPTASSQYTIDDVSYTVMLSKTISTESATESNVRVYAYGGAIYVANATVGDVVVISNVMGKVEKQDQIGSELQQFDMATSGIYIVRVGNDVFKVISK